MLFMGFYVLGGCFAGLFLSLQYAWFVYRKRSRRPWSWFLGIGLTLFMASIAFTYYADRYTAQGNQSWQDGFGGALFFLAPLIWLIGLLIWYRAYQKIKITFPRLPDMNQNGDQSGVWPPAPKFPRPPEQD